MPNNLQNLQILEDRILKLENKMDYYSDQLDPYELIQVKTDKDRILNHQAEMKSDIKDILKAFHMGDLKNSNKFNEIESLILKSSIDQEKRNADLEKKMELRLAKIESKMSHWSNNWTSVATIISILIGWALTIWAILKNN